MFGNGGGGGVGRDGGADGRRLRSTTVGGGSIRFRIGMGGGLGDPDGRAGGAASRLTEASSTRATEAMREFILRRVMMWNLQCG